MFFAGRDCFFIASVSFRRRIAQTGFAAFAVLAGLSVFALSSATNVSAQIMPPTTLQNGGAMQFVAQTSGALEVFVDRRAWIDVIGLSGGRDGATLPSIRSDRWLGCAGVGKNLGFEVTAGETYSLQLSEIDGAVADALLMPMLPMSTKP
jgi:hypothetical protein